ncbi:FkbM family methyltransferase [Ruegeria meonggei]|uniref:2-O-methyltransferase NoeI n=1 Tax=Ruegeria meonggei TaxID=1446476 RepID=A0A1X6Z6W6_9RHOB|nr:FkbM family methyltransferase [Ruegeria meonggei]SLN42706.1 2-O-methyltransferase NoeI [Ruegeria meonggei]
MLNDFEHELMEYFTDKLFRLHEAATLISCYAADWTSRLKLINIYRSLSKHETYDHPISLNLKIQGHTYPFCMRLSDIFILGEILFEQQYSMKSRLPEAPTIIDAGGNVGISALWFAGHYPQANLHIFEPASDNLAYLKKNARFWPGARIFETALGRRGGEVVLHMGKFGGMHSLMKNALAKGSAEKVVRVGTLADHMAEFKINKIDLLKLDIEGSELDVLIGLGNRINDVSVIVGEVHEAIIDPEDFFSYLREGGFKVLWTRRFHGSKEQQVHGFEAVNVA